MNDADIKERIERYSRESGYGGSLIIRHRISYNFRITIRRMSDDPEKKRAADEHIIRQPMNR